MPTLNDPKQNARSRRRPRPPKVRVVEQQESQQRQQASPRLPQRATTEVDNDLAEHATEAVAGANALGVLGLALGAMETFLPQLIMRGLGMKGDPDTRRILLACGLREICSGVGLLASERKAPWLWSRVAGDVLDIALVAAAPAYKKADPVRTGAVVAGLVAVGACDLLAAALANQQEKSETDALDADGIEATASVTVGVEPRVAYERWRDLAAAPRFMGSISRVEVVDEQHSRWEATGPAGITLSWNSRITDDVADTRIAWVSQAGSEILNRGCVEFAPGPGRQGTEVRVHIACEPPGGPVGAALGRLTQPQIQLRQDLRRFKQLLELGEVVLSDATLNGRDQRPAQPAPQNEKRTP